MRRFGIENPRRLAQLMLWSALVAAATYVSLGTLVTDYADGAWCYHLKHVMVCSINAAGEYGN